MMNDLTFDIDQDRITIGFVCDMEEAAESRKLRHLIELFVVGLGLDREVLRSLKMTQLKDLVEAIKQATMVGNANE